MALPAYPAKCTVESYGQPHTLSHHVYFKDEAGKYISPFHDLPTFATEDHKVVNMVCEVPRWSNAKMEISKSLPLNPIIQDSKKGKPRFVHNCFPHHGYIWNYGAIPQTWEDPTHTDPATNCKGDNDPIDICDISERVCTVGEIKQVKVLGIMAMIDEGETDWKVIGIDVNDPNAAKINDVDDIDKVMPGQLAATNEWFRIYKIPAGKPENTFAFNGDAKNRDFAIKTIEETMEAWKKMITGDGFEKISTMSTTFEGREFVKPEVAADIVSKAPAPAEPAPLDPSVHKWHYVKL